MEPRINRTRPVVFLLSKWQSAIVPEYANSQHIKAKQTFSMPKIKLVTSDSSRHSLLMFSDGKYKGIFSLVDSTFIKGP